jgi:membrane glycosyltransferase
MSRFNFGHGVLSYVSSPLWLLFLIFSTVLAKFPDPDRLQKAVNAGQLLLVLTGVLIFMPKTVILLDELFTGRLFKPMKLRLMTFIGSLMDTIIFTLMAPVMMWFHSKFVFKIVLGQGVKWVAQRRKLEGVDWREAILTFGEVTLLGVAWGAIAWWVGPMFMKWMSPIVVSMVLAIPIAIWLGSGKSGLRWGLFLTPEELEPPSVLSDLQDNLAEVKGRLQMPPEIEKSYGLMQVCLDPYVNGLHVSLLRRRNVKDTREYLDEIAERLVKQGPQGMKPVEINAIMNDADTVTALHHRLWAAGEDELAPFWSLAIKQYNLAATHPFAHLLANKEPVPQAA